MRLRRRAFIIVGGLILSTLLAVGCNKKAITTTNKPTTTTNDTTSSTTVENNNSIETYTITFVNYNDSVLSTQTLNKGEMPSFSGTPVKEADNTYTYTFNGWDNDIVAANSDATYKATFLPNYIDYTIKFIDHDDSEISSIAYHYNDTITIPDDPSWNHYEFLGWSLTKNGNVTTVNTNATESVTYYAQYGVDKFTYKFYEDDGTTIIKEETVNYDTLIEAPTNPTKDSTTEHTYTFDGWYTELTGGTKVVNFGKIADNVNYYARFIEETRKYTITWLDSDSNVIDTTNVVYGALPTHDNPTKEPTNEFTYEFDSWTPTIVEVSGDATYTAVFNSIERKYTYKFFDEDGTTIIKEETVNYDTLIEAPTNPTKDATAEYTYTFDGWYTELIGGTKVVSFGNITENINYYARYNETKNKHAIIWKNYDNSVIDIVNFEYGTTPIYSGDTPVKPEDSTYRYIFIGWTPEITTVTGAKEYTATFDEVEKEKPIFKYTITWKNYNGETLTTTEVEENTLPTYNGSTPTKESDSKYTYTFSNWSPTIAVATSGTTYTAEFSKTAIDYTITYVLNGGTNDSHNPIKYNADYDTIVLSDASKAGYHFTGWYLNSDLVTEIDTTNPSNITLVATFEENQIATYQIKHMLQDVDDESYYEEKESEEPSGNVGDLTMATARSYDGFVSPSSISQVTIEASGTIVYVYYTRAKYLVTIINQDDEIGSIDNDYQYNNKNIKYESIIELEIEVFGYGYEFDGWYINDSYYGNSTMLTYDMPYHDVTIEARYKKIQYRVTINNKVAHLDVDGIISGEKYDFNSAQTITPLNLPEGYYLKWTRSDVTNRSYYSKEFTFNVPDKPLTITIESISAYGRENTTEENYIYFGTYPQTLVKDEDLISQLTTKAGTLPTRSYSYKWTAYNNYVLMTDYDYMWYIDIDLNGDGLNDYRGVYYDEYRYKSYQKETYVNGEYLWLYSQERNGYTFKKVYWFKYEPIKWRILKEEDGKAFLLSELVLDSMPYNRFNTDSVSTTAEFEHNGGVGYANDYRLSDVRQWLINTFYNDAFTSLQQQIIEVTRVNACTTGAHVKDTYDKIFIPSKAEFEEIYGIYYGYGTCHIMVGKYGGTDYHICLGNDFNEFYDRQTWCWLTRTDHTDTDAITSGRWDFVGYKTEKINGVRPAMWINIDKLLNSNPSLTNDGYVLVNNEENPENSRVDRINSSVAFEMYVDDRFNITNRGTVVTGRVLRGTIRVGDKICISIPGQYLVQKYVVEVLGIEMYKKMVDYARQGDSVGLILGNQMTYSTIEKGSLITKYEEADPETDYNYYIKINLNPVSSGGLNQNIDSSLGCNITFSSNGPSVPYTCTINYIFDMNFDPVSSIAPNDTNNYVMFITTREKLCLYPGMIGVISSDGRKIANFEVISCGTDTNSVSKYMQDFDSITTSVKFEGNNGDYIYNDYVIYQYNSNMTFKELFKLAKNEFVNPGYEFVGYGIYISNDLTTDVYETVKDLTLTYLKDYNYRIRAIWEQVSFSSKIKSKSLIDEKPSIVITGNYEALSVGDELNVVLKDYSTIKVTISKIYNSSDEEISETETSGTYTLVLNGIDINDIPVWSIIYK